jgi:outer membrane lipoprotein carrier protein
MKMINRKWEVGSKKLHNSQQPVDTASICDKALPYYFSLLTFFALLLTSYFLLPTYSFAAEPVDLVTRIQKAYEGVKDISGSFTQKSHIKDLKRTDNYKGRFFIKPPSLKWEYTGETPQVIYVYNDQVMIYMKNDNQVFKSRFDRAKYGQAPLALLAGFGEIRKEFDVIFESADKLILTPKSQMGNIENIEIRTAESGFPIKTLSIIDNRKNRVDITLSNVKLNSDLKDSLFKFSPPKNAAILEN